MASLTLNVDTAQTAFHKSDDEAGFEIVTIATAGRRHYRISRERVNTRTIDYFDFFLDLTGVPSGTNVRKVVPYIPDLFSKSPTPLDFPRIPADFRVVLGASEQFKLLHLTPTVEGDPVREIPSYFNTKATYSMSGVPRPIRFVYWVLMDGQARYASPLGNLAFDDQYDHLPPIDPTKSIDIVSDGGVDYHVIRVSTTPGLVVGRGVSEPVVPVVALTDTYTLLGIQYRLTATAHSTQAWVGESGLRSNGFYVSLFVLGGEGGVELPAPGHDFFATPRASIRNAEVMIISAREFRFLIRPKPGVSSMDLKISITGRPEDRIIPANAR